MKVIKRLRISTFIIYAVAAMAAVVLLHTSQRVQESRERLEAIKADIAREQDSLRMLKAEWEYLNRPERLERLASEFLELAPPKPDAVSEAMIEEASTLLPDETEDNYGVEGTFTPAHYNVSGQQGGAQ